MLDTRRAKGSCFSASKGGEAAPIVKISDSNSLGNVSKGAWMAGEVSTLDSSYTMNSRMKMGNKWVNMLCQESVKKAQIHWLCS